MTDTRNIASFAISQGLLESALQMPQEHRIIGAEWDFAANAIRVYVEGPGLPKVPRGGQAPSISPFCTRIQESTGNQRIVWNWGL